MYNAPVPINIFFFTDHAIAVALDVPKYFFADLQEYNDNGRKLHSLKLNCSFNLD